MLALAPTARARAQGSAAQPQPGRAPFGLIWGMSAESVHKLVEDAVGPDLAPYYNERVGHGADGSASGRFFHLPRVPNGTEFVDLSFGYRDRLFNVYVEGKSGQADDVMTRYKELSSLLSELYGPGSETVTPQSWFQRADPNSILRDTYFDIDQVHVELSLLSGYGAEEAWTISYWNLAGLAEFQGDRHSHAKDAL
jgi:hypothetical protein